MSSCYSISKDGYEARPIGGHKCTQGTRAAQTHLHKRTCTNATHALFDGACFHPRAQFVIDFVSILPFWLMTLDFDDPLGTAAATSLVDSEPRQGGAARASVLIRIIKLMRMLKLARVFKASRVMQRVLMDIVMVS